MANLASVRSVARATFFPTKYRMVRRAWLRMFSNAKTSNHDKSHFNGLSLSYAVAKVLVASKSFILCTFMILTVSLQHVSSNNSIIVFSSLTITRSDFLDVTKFSGRFVARPDKYWSGSSAEIQCVIC